MSKGLDVDVLRTFHAVARLGRFKDAAAYVHRSASAVTAQIQRLEGKVGKQLLVRSNQSVELTQAGRQLLAESTRFLMAHDRLLATLSPKMMTGKIRLGVPDGYAARLMTDFLPLFVASNPKLQLQVETRSSGELLDLFARQQLDLTLAVSQKPLEQGELLSTTQPRWVAAGHFTYDTDLPLPLALQLSGCPYRETALAALKARGVDHRLLLESANWAAVEACVRSGLAIGIVEMPRRREDAELVVAGLDLPLLPEHSVYLLTDPSHHIALHLHEMLTSMFADVGGCMPQ